MTPVNRSLMCAGTMSEGCSRWRRRSWTRSSFLCSVQNSCLWVWTGPESCCTDHQEQERLCSPKLWRPSAPWPSSGRNTFMHHWSECSDWTVQSVVRSPGQQFFSLVPVRCDQSWTCCLCFSVKGPELINMYVGQSEQNIREGLIRTSVRTSMCVNMSSVVLMVGLCVVSVLQSSLGCSLCRLLWRAGLSGAQQGAQWRLGRCDGPVSGWFWFWFWITCDFCVFIVSCLNLCTESCLSCSPSSTLSARLLEFLWSEPRTVQICWTNHCWGPAGQRSHTAPSWTSESVHQNINDTERSLLWTFLSPSGLINSSTLESTRTESLSCRFSGPSSESKTGSPCWTTAHLQCQNQYLLHTQDQNQILIQHMFHQSGQKPNVV